MNKFLLMALFLLGFSAPGFSQDEVDDSGDRINSARIAFLSNRLKLTSEQAKTFWPVYTEFDKERRNNRQVLKQLRQSYATLSTDEEVRDALKKMMDVRQREVDIEKNYMSRFLKVISPRQVAALYKAELDFQGELLKRLRERRTGMQNK